MGGKKTAAVPSGSASITKPPTIANASGFWPKLDRKSTVFLAEFEIPANHAVNPGKSPAWIGIFSGTAPSEYGPTIEFKVIELVGTAAPREHHLSQGGKSIIYQTKPEQVREEKERAAEKARQRDKAEMTEWIGFGGDVMVAMEELTKATNVPQAMWDNLWAEYKAEGKPKGAKKWAKAKLEPHFKWMNARARWTEDEGHWGFIGVKPMILIGQCYIPEDHEHDGAPHGDMLFLFADLTKAGLEFKIISQMCGAQTAKAHYKLEEQIALYRSQKGSTTAANELVQKGDKWAHGFLLEQPNLDRQTLELLAKKGGTKEIKEQAKARLGS